jgi:hypothetical protein
MWATFRRHTARDRFELTTLHDCIKSPASLSSANQFFSLGVFSFNPEPTATASLPRFIAVAVGSGLNERKTDWPCIIVERDCRFFLAAIRHTLGGKRSAFGDGNGDSFPRKSCSLLTLRDAFQYLDSAIDVSRAHVQMGDGADRGRTYGNRHQSLLCEPRGELGGRHPRGLDAEDE